MLKIFEYTVLLFFISLLISCSTKNEGTDYSIYSSLIYSGCCGTEPASHQVGDGVVYVANMYTPNWDGTNDFFIPVSDSGIAAIRNMEIRDRNGDFIWSTDSIILNWPMTSWQPWDSNNVQYKGLFRYSFEAFDTNGVSAVISGNACCFICDVPTSVIADTTQCTFPDQFAHFLLWDTAFTVGFSCH